MWGDPRDPRLKGAAYLTHETRKQLGLLMGADDDLAELMSRLTALITFGPDARAGGEAERGMLGHGVDPTLRQCRR